MKQSSTNINKDRSFVNLVMLIKVVFRQSKIDCIEFLFLLIAKTII